MDAPGDTSSTPRLNLLRRSARRMAAAALTMTPLASFFDSRSAQKQEEKDLLTQPVKLESGGDTTLSLSDRSPSVSLWSVDDQEKEAPKANSLRSAYCDHNSKTFSVAVKETFSTSSFYNDSARNIVAGQCQASMIWRSPSNKTRTSRVSTDTLRSCRHCDIGPLLPNKSLFENSSTATMSSDLNSGKSVPAFAAEPSSACVIDHQCWADETADQRIRLVLLHSKAVFQRRLLELADELRLLKLLMNTMPHDEIGKITSKADRNLVDEQCNKSKNGRHSSSLWGSPDKHEDISPHPKVEKSKSTFAPASAIANRRHRSVSPRFVASRDDACSLCSTDSDSYSISSSLGSSGFLLDERKDAPLCEEESAMTVHEPYATALPRTPRRVTTPRHQPTASTPITRREALQFKKQRESLTREWFSRFNATVFDERLPSDIPLEWNSRLVRTAGQTIMTVEKGTKLRSTRIHLSCRVLDRRERLLSTLLHEMCHAAQFLLEHEERPAHGPGFQKWAKRAASCYPDIPVTVTHNYRIYQPKRYQCVECGHIYGRNSKIRHPDRVRCGKPECHGSLIFLGHFNCDGTRAQDAASARPLTPYNRFIKNNFGETRTANPHLSYGEVMSVLASQWRAVKRDVMSTPKKLEQLANVAVRDQESKYSEDGTNINISLDRLEKELDRLSLL